MRKETVKFYKSIKVPQWVHENSKQASLILSGKGIGLTGVDGNLIQVKKKEKIKVKDPKTGKYREEVFVHDPQITCRDVKDVKHFTIVRVIA